MSNEPPSSAPTNASTDSSQAGDLSKGMGEDDINVAHLQRLARLALEPAQAKAAQDDLRNIIAMIDAMQAVPTDGVEPLTHPLETAARLRPDRVTEVVDRETFQRVAPATDAGFYLVPKVIE